MKNVVSIHMVHNLPIYVFHHLHWIYPHNLHKKLSNAISLLYMQRNKLL